MNYPNSLLKRKRLSYPSEKIGKRHLMFARHKPLQEWKEGEDFPQFSSIKINQPQSFNWSAFSIPLWVRYTDLKEYREGYGVVGYRVDTFRYTSKIDSSFNDYTLDVKHSPLEYNYSHCELVVNSSLTKKERRNIRLTFSHNCVVSILPNSSPSNFRIVTDYLRMLVHRLTIQVA